MIPHLKSLRSRLLAWHGGLSALLIAGFACTTYHLEKNRRLAEIDAHLTQKLSLLSDALRREKRQGKDVPLEASDSFQKFLQTEFPAESRVYCAVWLRDPKPIARSASTPTSLSRPTSLEKPIQTRPPFREIHLSMAPVDLVLVGSNVQPDLDELSRLQHRLWIAGTTVFIGGLLVGAALSRRAAAPIEAILEAAHRVAQGQLSERIPLVCAADDLSRLAQQLNLCFESLERLFQQQGRFTSASAHELRTPLSVILAQTQSILRRERSPAEYREALETIGHAAHRMQRLTEMLLNLARLDAHANSLHPQVIDLSQTALTLWRQLHSQGEGRHLSFSSSLQPTFARVDPEHLAVILSNLLTNALRHNLPNGWIHLTSSQSDTHSSLLIENASSPIPTEHLPSLFERFFRLDASRSTEGFGLGLSIARDLAHLNAGSLFVEANPASTRFTLRFPRPQDNETATPPTEFL